MTTVYIQSFALHITWTCYGTWLPGDPRGYVSNTLLPKGGFVPKQNVPDTAFAADDANTYLHAQRLQKSPTIHLSTDHALIAAHAIVEAARARTWLILRAALMANHIHVVIADCPTDGAFVRRVLKGVSDTKLRKAFPGQGRWWTKGGSDRYKNTPRAIEAAIDYVANQEHILVAIDNMRVYVPGQEESPKTTRGPRT
jgi:REP element-mobilizing transposase RayT